MITATGRGQLARAFATPDAGAVFRPRYVYAHDSTVRIEDSMRVMDAKRTVRRARDRKRRWRADHGLRRLSDAMGSLAATLEPLVRSAEGLVSLLAPLEELWEAMVTPTGTPRESRKWHLEHADGREWTGEELDGALPRTYDEPNGCRDVLVNDAGTAFLLDLDGVLWSSVQLGAWRDMEVVWDV